MPPVPLLREHRQVFKSFFIFTFIIVAVHRSNCFVCKEAWSPKPQHFVMLFGWGKLLAPCSVTLAPASLCVFFENGICTDLFVLLPLYCWVRAKLALIVDYNFRTHFSRLTLSFFLSIGVISLSAVNCWDVELFFVRRQSTMSRSKDVISRSLWAFCRRK